MKAVSQNYDLFYFYLFILKKDREEFDEARKLWAETHDPEAALAIFPKRAYAERKLLNFYIRNPDSHAKAIKSVSKKRKLHEFSRGKNKKKINFFVLFLVTQEYVIFVFSCLSILHLEPCCI